EAQNAPFAQVELDLHLSDAGARADRLDHRDERLGHLACGVRPLLETPWLEGLSHDEASAVEAKELTRRAVESHDRASGIHDDQGVVHARQDGLELERMPFVLDGHLIARAKSLDGRARLRRYRAQAEKVVLVIRLGQIALRGQHADHTLAQQDRDDGARSWRDQLPRLRPVEETDRRTLGGPLHEAWRAGTNDLAGETLAEREGAAAVLIAAVHLPDHLHGLADFVIRREQEDGRIHHARRLVVHRAEQLYEIARIRSERPEATRKLESRAQVIVMHGRRLQHVPQPPASHRVNLRAQRLATGH